MGQSAPQILSIRKFWPLIGENEARKKGEKMENVEENEEKWKREGENGEKLKREGGK